MPNLLRSARAFVGQWWSSALAVPVTGALAGIAGLTSNDYFDLFSIHHVSWSITIFVLALIAGFLGTAETTRKLRKWRREAERAAQLNLRAETAELALIETVCDELRHLIAALGLYSDGRASLFICKHDHFVLAGRFSPMPKFGQSAGRHQYPLDSGILGEAWNDGEAADPDLPDPGPVNKPPARGWLQRQARHGVAHATASAFAMRSRCYSAIRLEYDRRRLGAIVIESTLPADETAISSVTAARGGSLQALKVLAGSKEIIILSRALHHLRHLDGEQLRERVAKYLPDR